ncbi:MAG TPA: DUF1223 domain-containing protein [Candidatus Dormibacteraeota bacterium]|nr:DUF1223 domain-containing protein [Candidatus Dormibacteraeota bacterium]
MSSGFLRVLLTGAPLFIVGMLGSRTVTSQGSRQTPAPAKGSPVVVELFTSEGCSSCPPADALLARLAEESSAGHAQVVALEEHVDYWDDLGWRDPFSSHRWTERQYVYAGVLGNGNPYTPQMVVDGGVEFTGSRAQQAQRAIAEAASRAKIPVSLSEQRAESRPGTENFLVEVGKLIPSKKGGAAEVWLAITETGLHSSVSRGENAGNELRHAAVVRLMRKIGEAKADGDVSFAGKATVSLRGEWKQANLKAVAFVQEKNSLRILGATEVPLQ